jgi:hypothetical protein
MPQPHQNGDEKTQVLDLRRRVTVSWRKGMLSPAWIKVDALGILAPGNEQIIVSEFIELTITKGSPSGKAAKSVAEQNSVVRVQVGAPNRKLGVWLHKTCA